MERTLDQKPPPSGALPAGDWSVVPATKPLPRKIDYRPYGCAAMVAIAAAVVLAPVGCLAYAWYDLSQPPGEVQFVDWPPLLQTRHAEWKQAGVDVDGMQVYLAADFFDTESYCRVRYTPETWAYLKERYESEGDAASARLMWAGVRSELPDWAPNLDHPGVVLLPLEPFHDGEHVRLAYDPGRQMIYINYLTIF